METDRWPFFDLSIDTPRLTLRVPSDEHLDRLADLAAGGIHDLADMPFLTPWSDLQPFERGRSVLQWCWRCRGELTAESWKLGFAVFEGDECVGVQDVFAEQFALRRTVTTGSWLGQRHQGKGIGKEMRAAVLHLAFAGLGAQRAETSGFTDNPRSLGVTRALGYQECGDDLLVRRGQVARCLRFSLEREAWKRRRRRRHDITIHGLEPCLTLLGADS